MAGFMVSLLSCSVGVSALALLYIALTPLLARRYSEAGRYYAWLALVVGLIVPFRPRFDHPVLRVELPVEALTPIIGADSGAPVAAFAGRVADRSQAVSSALAGMPWWQLATAVWLVGALAFLGYHAVRHFRFEKLAARWREDVADEWVLALFRGVKREMGITGRIGLCRCACVGSPMMIGILHPRILLPSAELGRDELRFVFMHELIHYRRRDLWYKCLVLIATAMHWFNPVAHLMARAIGAQCESSCDAEVLRGADAEARRRYGETIIGVVRRQSGPNPALSTNFYGGKRGMKKRIFSIMDMGGKRTGIAVVCCALLLTLGTGLAFAANAPQASVGATLVEQGGSYSKAGAYGKYAEFGLSYDPATDDLYYGGELVRYFEDWYPVDEDGNAYAGTDYLNENGTIDAHGVRDSSRIVYNADGSYDPSAGLVGVAPYTRAEFDARDVAALQRPTYNTAVSADASGAGDGITSNFVLAGDTKEAFKVYAPFGLTYDGDDIFRYHGKTVRRFVDAGGATAFTRAVANDCDVSVDLTAIRDASGKLTGLIAADRDEFDARTKRIEQTQAEMEQFYKDHPNVTVNSVVETSDMGADSIADAASSNAVVRETTEASYDSAYATSVGPNAVVTNLSEYLSHGVSYDASRGAWMFGGKEVAFLVDPGRQLYVNFSEDNADSDFSARVEASNKAFLKVIRTSGGTIDRVVELSADEAVDAITDAFAADSSW